MAAGVAHSLAVAADGTLWSWGDNSSGQLGDGTRVPRTAPTRVTSFQGTPVAVAAGAAHSVALGSDGAVWAWGLNDAGQLGDGTTSMRRLPTRVTGLVNAVGIAAGARHTLAIRADGRVMAWGDNDAGQLGDGTTRRRLTPVAVAGPSGVVAVAAGLGHSLAVTGNGELWAWGDNTFGQLGDGARQDRKRAVRIAVGERVVGAVAAGAVHSLVLGASGAVYAFGANLAGQLGDGTHVTRSRPVRVHHVSDVVAVSAGVAHSVAVTASGGLWMWGGFSTSPRTFVLPSAVQATVAGGAHNLAVTAEGAVWAQGINLFGQLGDGTRTSRADFVPISGPAQAWGVHPPLFSPGEGLYDAPQAVIIWTPTIGAAIHYTTNGSDPTTADPQIASRNSVRVDQTTQLKARAFRSGMAPSAVVRQQYVIEPPAPPGDLPPPDPATIAPPLPEEVITSFADAVSFLYRGPQAIQRGVSEGAIDSERVAVVRGRVLTRDGNPLAGARVIVRGQPSVGYAVSRVDGLFDLALNAGGPVVIEYACAGYLPVQRRVEPAWNAFDAVPDVRLVQLDPQVTVIDLSGVATAQVARGSTSFDADGARQATLIVPAGGVTATMTLEDGSVVPALSRLSIRATEYTVGSGGEQAMPGPLPGTSGYTYAVELSADEALAAGATTVAFDRPLAFYLENFLDFPVGGIVPVGHYDRGEARWIAGDNGRVVRVLAIDTGRAVLDVDGFGLAATEEQQAAMGITPGELERAAALYPAGQSLWRVPVSHFSPHDYNWPVGPPLSVVGRPGAGAPDLRQFPDSFANRSGGRPGFRRSANGEVDDPCQASGSIVECQNQTLGEAIPVAGTAFTLTYRSDRATGPAGSRSIRIPVTTLQVPDELKRVDVDIAVAGRETRRSFAPAAGLETTYVWDGLDRFGRRVTGAQDVDVTVTYVYPAVYYAPADYPRSFAVEPGATVVQDRARGEVGVQQKLSYTVDARRRGQTPIAGWNLDAHHRYDPQSQTLFLGTGEQRTAAAIGDVVGTIAGGGQTPVGAVDVPAEFAAFEAPLRSLAVAASGEVFVADRGGILVKDRESRVRRVSTFVENQDDPQPALATGPGAGVYVATRRLASCLETDAYFAVDIHYLTATGNRSGFATVPVAAPCHQPAVLASVAGALLLAAGSAVVIVDPSGGYVPVVGLPLGTQIWSMAGARDGTVYLGTRGQIWKVDPGGRANSIAGRAAGGGEEIVAAPLGTAVSALDQDADQVRLRTITAMALDAQGSLLFADHQPGAETSVLKALTSSGEVISISGDEAAPAGSDGVLARASAVHSVFGMTAAPGGETLYVDNAPAGARVRRLAPALADDDQHGDVDVPSADGALVYRFTPDGLHRRTLDTLTGVGVFSFAYDLEGRLIAIDDRDGLRTLIVRASNGDPLTIVSPFGVVTSLTVNAEGSLTAVADPEGRQVALGYGDGGLLTSLVDANGHVHRFTYDSRGRLIRDDDPAGGFQVLDRTSETDRWTVTRTVADGGAVVYTTEQLTSGATRRITTGPDGSETIATNGGDGSSIVVTPDGTTSTSSLAADPRFRFAAPITSSASVTTPSGLTMTVVRDRSVVLVTPQDLLSVLSLTDTTNTNEQVARSVFNVPDRTITSTTPANRSTVTSLDAKGRLGRMQVGSLAATEFSYNNLGQLVSRSQGGRTTTFTYDARGYVASITDPLDRTVRFTNDATGRRLEQALPDGRVVAFSYDGNGNLLSLAPPGRPAHRLAYTAVDRLESYTAPTVSGHTPTTRYAFNLAGSPATVTRADAQVLHWNYDAIGRLAQLDTPEGPTSYEYQPGTGQLTMLRGPSSVLSYTYDGSLQTSESWSGVVSGAVSWTFDNHFRVRSERVGDGVEAAFGYDADGLLTAAGALSLTRDPANGFITEALIGGISTIVGYNEFGEVSREETTGPGSGLFRADYTRDAVGRLTDKTETVAGVTTVDVFAYDLAGRLIDVRRDGAALAHYAYDANGNRTLAGAVPATYDDQDRLITYGARTYQHTAAGEVAGWSDPTAGETTTLTYDTQGNLLRVGLPSGTVVEYVADARNRRVLKRVNGAPVQGFLYQGQLRPVAELDGAGAIVSRFVYGARATSPEYFVREGVTYRLITDHIGSVRLVVDAVSGEVVQRLDYDPYGRVLQDTNPGFQPFGYAGGLYDHQTGLVRFGVRDYDPEIGRWLSKDPIGFRGDDTNLYMYAGGDPINHLDPPGLDWIDSGTLKTLADLSAGFGDTLTMGGTAKLRAALDFNDVDTCSWSYSVGQWSAYAHTAALGLASSFVGGARTVFYAGQGSRTAAMAGKGTGTIIDDTIGGHVLRSTEKLLGRALPVTIWKVASATFAANAKGVATVFLREPLRPNNLFSTVEQPILNWMGVGLKLK